MMIYHCPYRYYYNHYYWKLNITSLSQSLDQGEVFSHTQLILLLVLLVNKK